METILEQLTPETITYIEEVYGSIAGWIDVVAGWTAEQWAALNNVVTNDIHL